MASGHCLVVGYGPGVGQGIAQAFAGAGYSLGLIARRPERQQLALEALRQAGAEVELLAADAGDAPALTAALQGLLRPDLPTVLVYNAVAPTLGPPTALTPERLLADLQVDVAGALAAALAVLPTMQERGEGSLLFTGGGFAHHPVAATSSIGIGKSALRALALCLSEELRPGPVRVGLLTIMGMVAPGTAFDPGRIGEAFLALHHRLGHDLDPEWLYRGDA
ncbi:MAG: SDR family NAD(P)-dependent oxidoreductase [Cyanobacteriota bacterium]